MDSLKDKKIHIRRFMREHYSDEQLAALLAHARDGKLSFYSCCCFIGIATADHALRGAMLSVVVRDNLPSALCEDSLPEGTHFDRALDLSGAWEAEHAFSRLGKRAKSRRILIPMIRAEMKRRELARKPASGPDLAAVCRDLLLTPFQFGQAHKSYLEYRAGTRGPGCR